jgi:hypothetical protein
MKLLLLLLPFCCMAQHNRFVNFELSADPNKMFHIIDNPRTEEDHKGLDFDLELGAADRGLYVYLFYGRFEQADYQNYGFGADGFLVSGPQWELKAGAAVSVVMRKQLFGNRLQTEGWGAALGYHLRVLSSIRLNKNFALTGKIQYHRRGDLGAGILEVAGGVSYRFYRRL